MTNALAVAREYHDAWTSNDFAHARTLLADDLQTEVPLDTYRDAGDFAQALTAFGSMVTGVRLLAEFGANDEAMLLYDLDVTQLGPLRVAEHFTIANGQITRIRHVHDTATLRAAGFAAST